MPKRDPAAVRALTVADESALRRLLETSEYTYVRFTPDELPRLLATRPAVGTFSVPPGPLGRVTGGTLHGFLLVNSLVPPSAWIGGFGVTWSESGRYREHLDLLLPAIDRAVAARGARTLYYSGHDMQTDWLRTDLEARGFRMISTLRSYDKYDRSIPSPGNQSVRVRRFVAADAPGVVAVENEAFAPLWRYDADGFREVNELYPYFVVAEDDQGIVGYQFNAVDGLSGYLVRIAVHPRVEGQGVGTRLMADAVRYFISQGVTRILLNTEETNSRAHRLYERFGFHLVHPRGFVLARDIAGV
jgi:[ribosomal protein S18]-alanine N-acetyltransferase